MQRLEVSGAVRPFIWVVRRQKVKVKTGLDSPRGFQEPEAPRFQDIRHMKGLRLSVLSTGRLYPQDIFLVHISLIGPASSVGIATDFGLDDLESNPGGDEIFRPSRTVAFTLQEIFLVLISLSGPASSVGNATDYGLDDLGSNPGGNEIFRQTRPARGPTQPPVK